MTSLGTHFSVNKELALSDSSATFRGKMYRISILSDRLIRLEYNANGNFNDNLTLLAKNRNFTKPNITFEENERYLTISSKYFNLRYLKEKPFLGTKLAPDANLKVTLNETDKIWYYNHPEVRNYNGNIVSLEDFANIKNLKGLYSTDGFVTIDDSNSLLLDEYGYVHKSSDEYVDLYLFMYKRDFGYCLNDYFKLTGFPIILPRYALGIWWNRDRIYSFDNTKTLVQAFNKYEIPLSVLLLSEFWHIKDKNNYNLYKSGYTFNKELFPHPEDFTKYMHDRGIKVGIDIDVNEGIRQEEDCYSIISKNMGINDNTTIPFNVLDTEFISSFIEYAINPLLNIGIDFFWIKYNKSNEELQALDYYILKNFERDKTNRGMILTQNPIKVPHKYSVLYSGKTEVTWRHLNNLPKYISGCANAGISWLSNDVGGFRDGVEDSELYLRHVQLATFSPIFRFSAIRGPYYKREPWMWDVKTYTLAKEYCNLRHRLIPYIYSENYQYYKTGMPIARPLYYTAPSIIDEPLYANEYYFGKELLIAPITKPKDYVMNRAIEQVYIPEGKWYDFKTGKRFNGDKRYVVFYKDQDYPIFVKAGAIIPMAVLKPNRNDVSNPTDMEIHVFPGQSNIYKLYEDDGISSLYKEGYYIVTAIDYNYLANNYTLIIHPTEGKTGIIPNYRNYKIRFRNTKPSAEVSVYMNGDKATNKIETYVEDNDFIVTVYDVDTTKQMTINCKGSDIEIDAIRVINEDINSIITDLTILTSLKEKLAKIIFSNLEISKKRIEIKKLNKEGLDQTFIKMFLKLLEYIAEI